jgi:hypothetical protein
LLIFAFSPYGVAFFAGGEFFFISPPKNVESQAGEIPAPALILAQRSPSSSFFAQSIDCLMV